MPINFLVDQDFETTTNISKLNAVIQEIITDTPLSADDYKKKVAEKAVNEAYSYLNSRYTKEGTFPEWLLFDDATTYYPGDFIYSDGSIDSNIGFYVCIAEVEGEELSNTLFFEQKDIRPIQAVETVVNLTIYRIHMAGNARTAPERVQILRDDTISWLKMVADVRKNINPDFPLIEREEQKGNDLTWGSQTRNNWGQDVY